VHRRLFIALALIAMLWNGVAGAMVRNLADVAADAEHAALHFEDVGHHHHDDGGYHVDDSGASVAHVALDTSHTNLSISGSSERLQMPSLGSPPTEFLVSAVPSPYLPPLQRPPRPLS